MRDNSSIIKLDDIVKVYLSGEVKTTAIRGISLELKEGKTYLVVGPSGSGKSTLLNILGMLDSPTAGNVYFKEENVSKWSMKQQMMFRRKNVGFVFQNSNLFPNYSIYQNLKIALYYSKLSKVEKENEIKMMIGSIGLEGREKSLPSELSGGQKQRVAVAAALIKKPTILIADEPTAELDMENKSNIIDLILDLHNYSSKTCIVIASHDSYFKERVNVIIQLEDGLKLNESMSIKKEKKPESQEEKIIEIKKVLSCPSCNSNSIKKFYNDDDKHVRIVGDSAIGLGTIFCSDCGFSETKEYILFRIRRT